MIDNLFDKQQMRRRTAEPSPVAETEAVDDFGAFGWLRNGRDRASMLEFRHQDGRITAYGYGWLESAEFNPSTGITLNFSGKTVKLIGRNLNIDVRPNIRLFEGILNHRVAWIQEADELTIMESPESAVVVERVEIE